MNTSAAVFTYAGFIVANNDMKKVNSIYIKYNNKTYILLLYHCIAGLIGKDRQQFDSRNTPTHTVYKNR